MGYCAAGPLVGLTASLPALIGALFVWGAFQGSLDVAMNTQAITVERASRQMLMSGLHGCWSIGAFAGAAIGALAVGAGITLTPQLLVLGTLALLAAGLLTTRMLPDAAGRPSSGRQPDGRRGSVQRAPAASRWSGGMVLLGAIAFASMLCEGADRRLGLGLPGRTTARGRRRCPAWATPHSPWPWSSVRLSGNRLLSRVSGPIDCCPRSRCSPQSASRPRLLIAQPAAALVGFACLGVGLASVVPAVFSAAGRIPGLHPGRPSPPSRPAAGPDPSAGRR